MRKFILLSLFALLAAPLFSQSKAELVECLKLALSSTEMQQAFTQEWGELRPLYLRQSSESNISGNSAAAFVAQLTAEDFTGFAWEVVPKNEEELRLRGLPDESFGVLSLGGGFRGQRLVLNLVASLPQSSRKLLASSFSFEKKGEEWLIVEKAVEVY